MNEAPRFDPEDTERDENVVDLFAPRPKPEGKEPPNGDWLSHLKSGTEFLCRDRTGHLPKWVVLEYTHGGLLKGNVLLIPTKTLNDIRTWQWCDPIEFCKSFEFRGIIEEPE